ncbi:hypothetical protein [Nitrosomonas sp. Nm34]|uniref:hypothetical protein n=1 Tax=Nitrosomonas sp. Nm34 TaxID=1881055 RepID=UPI001587A434|nr:hypothetical protein [Nitrosomonas sp. Nm34]
MYRKHAQSEFHPEISGADVHLLTTQAHDSLSQARRAVPAHTASASAYNAVI